MSAPKQSKSVEEELEEYNIPTHDANGKELTKAARKKLLVKAKKDSKKNAAAQKNQAAQSTKQVEADTSEGRYGEKALIQSQEKTGKQYVEVKNLNKSNAGQTVIIRGRLHNIRPQAKVVFLVIRQQFSTIQAVCTKPACSNQMLNFLKKISSESIIDVTATVVETKDPVKSTSQQDIELNVTDLWVISSAAPNLPIIIEDAERAYPVIKAQKQALAAIEKKVTEARQSLETAEESSKAEIENQILALAKEKSDAQKFVILSRATRLDNRFIDLRTSANQAIMRISSGVCTLFREFLLQKGFVEIHTPKLLGAASEGGADVFEVGNYFGTKAYLAQSPQLYKQMAISADLDRVFEIGPVFRAENSRSKRHMTEFVGLDMEMTIFEHYHEVLDIFDELFVFLFDGLNERFKLEIEAVKRQFPFKDLEYKKPSLRLQWPEAISLLRENGIEHGDLEDFNIETERKLGGFVKEKYGTDFYMLDRFPSDIRPFYTMPAPDDAAYSNSYDFFIRGQEILSGAQRIHDPAFLAERALSKGVPPSSIQDYIDCFKYGAYPHGGGGIGLERVVMLFLNIQTVQQVSMFPRTPTRLRP